MTAINRRLKKRLKGEVDLSRWYLPMLERLQDEVQAGFASALSQALDAALDSDHTNVSLAAAFCNADGTGDEYDNCANSRRVVNPLDVYLEIAIAGNPDNNPVYAFNIADTLKEYIKECKEDGSFAEGLVRISSALREWADKIDASLPKP